MVIRHIHVNINGFGSRVSQGGQRYTLRYWRLRHDATKDETHQELKRNNTFLVNSAELAEIIGTDIQTVNNWIAVASSAALHWEDGNSGIGCFRRMRSTRRL